MPEAVVTTTNYGWSTVRKASSVDEQRDWYTEYINFANEIDAQVYANEAKADAAQADATQALSDAADAQTDATQALADSASAQSDATQALSDALDNAAEIVAISPIKLFGTTTSSGSENTDILSLTRGGTDYPSIVDSSYKSWKVSLTAYGLVTGSTEVRAKWSGELQFAEDATGGGEVSGYMEPDFSFYMLSDITLSTLVFDCDSNEIKITVGHTDTSGSSTIYWDLIAVQQEAAGWFGT